MVLALINKFINEVIFSTRILSISKQLVCLDLLLLSNPNTFHRVKFSYFAQVFFVKKRTLCHHPKIKSSLILFALKNLLERLADKEDKYQTLPNSAH